MSSPKNIIFIVLDTLRSDALSIYNPGIYTPHIERLSLESTIFTNNIASAPWTIPSHASMFTGKYPMEHHVHFGEYDRDFITTSKLMNDYRGKTVAEVLKEQGYSTIGMSANTGIVPGSGFDRGFDTFTLFDPMGNFTLNNNWSLLKNKVTKRLGDSRNTIFKNLLLKGSSKDNFSLVHAYFNLRKEVRKSYKYNNFPFNKSGKSMIDFIFRSSFSQPFFLFVNFMESHEPYNYDFSPEKEQLYSLGLLNPSHRTIRKVRESYYSESSLIDWEIGEIIRFLIENNLYDDTVIIITSDHGQSLFEHGFYGHGIYLHDELINVPLIIKKAAKDTRHEVYDKIFSNTGLFDMIKSIGVDNEFKIP